MQNLRNVTLSLIACLLMSPITAHAQVRVAAPLDLSLPRLNSARPPQSDSVKDGVLAGAAIGAAAGVSLVAIGYATCDGSCNAPAPGPFFAGWAALGAGLGAVGGWVVDGLRHTTRSGVTVAVTPTPRRKAVRVVFLFR